MDQNTYDYYEEREEKKRSKVLNWIVDKWNKATSYYERHETFCNTVALLGSALIGVGAKLIEKRSKKITLKKEEELKTLFCYDRKLGHYWKLKQPLSNSQWLRIQEEVSNGALMGDALERMGVLAKK